MNMSLLLPAIEGLDLVDVRCENGQILVEARTTCSATFCPSCEQKTERVHSFYGRTIQDLPWSGCPVTINLRVRRFFCDNANCKRLVFCERLAPHIASCGRHTDHQRKLLQMLAVAMGGEMTARLLPKLGLSGSPAMLLNTIRAMPVRPLSARQAARLLVQLNDKLAPEEIQLRVRYMADISAQLWRD